MRRNIGFCSTGKVEDSEAQGLEELAERVHSPLFLRLIVNRYATTKVCGADFGGTIKLILFPYTILDILRTCTTF